MAIDKAVNPLGNPSEVDIEIINPDAVIIREDDDGFLAILGPELSEQIMPDFDGQGLAGYSTRFLLRLRCGFSLRLLWKPFRLEVQFGRRSWGV